MLNVHALVVRSSAFDMNSNSSYACPTNAHKVTATVIGRNHYNTSKNIVCYFQMGEVKRREQNNVDNVLMCKRNDC